MFVRRRLAGQRWERPIGGNNYIFTRIFPRYSAILSTLKGIVSAANTTLM